MGKEFKNIGKYMSTSMRKISKMLEKDYDVDYDDYENYIWFIFIKV